MKPQVGAWSQASVATTVVNALLCGDVLTLQRLTHADVVDRSSGTDLPTGWTGLRERALTLCADLPDGVTAELVCSEGDTAVCRVRTPDRRRGFPAPAAPADGAVVLFVLRFRNGLVGEIWSSSEVAAPFLAVASASACA